MPIKAIAPIGKGFAMMPTMVATKIANRCHAAGWTPEGGGINQITTASKNTAAKTAKGFLGDS